MRAIAGGVADRKLSSISSAESFEWLSEISVVSG